MRAAYCGQIRAHSPHTWITVLWQRTIGQHTVRLNGARRACPGGTVARCGRTITHPAHWHGEARDELCPGGGLAGYCEHGVQMLNECPDCP